MSRDNATSKSIKLIMAFAIFWMVIGDLITYHQEKIFGTNFYEHHSPFTKPGGKDDGKTSHLKVSKDFDKQSWFKTDLIACQQGAILPSVSQYSLFLSPKPYLVLRHQCLRNILSLRGPPAI